MLPVWKLERLPAGQRRRKLALLLADLERAFARDATASPSVPADVAGYLFSVIELTLKDDKLMPEAAADITRLLAAAREDDSTRACLLRLCNHARNALLAAIGTFPAEWDLVMAGTESAAAGGASAADGAAPADGAASGGGENGAGRCAPTARMYHPGLVVYAEDIRSPFNLGSIFRTAEAFGAERLLLSPLCAPADHPRAIRSAMGCDNYLPHGTASLAELPEGMPVFALETGGTPIDEFDFPERGIVIVGSEELGVSPEALERASYGRVSIPMTGIKASLNVGVAFGILMQRWTAYLPCSVSKPF